MKILIIGGNRFFGKKLARLLCEEHSVTLLNRGNLDDGLGVKVSRIQCDRSDEAALHAALEDTEWDIVFDQCCYEATEASQICKVLKGKAQKLVFISSQSVFDAGKNLKEENFNPTEHSYTEVADKNKDYSEAKRQCEAVLFKEATFPVIAARFPIVLGDDDYTERLKFHIQRIRDSQEIYFPNLEARISFIHSTDAAVALSKMLTLDFSGPINLCTSEPIKLKALIQMIEKYTGKKMTLAESASKENHSPFGISSDWYMNTDRANELGLQSRAFEEWLNLTIRSYQ